MAKTCTAGAMVIIGVLLVCVSAGSQIHQDNSKQTESQLSEMRLFDKEVVDATPTQLGVLTERQRSHSKLYAFYAKRSRRTISDFIAHPEAKVVGIHSFIGLGPVMRETQTPEDYFGRLANASDAIIRGKVIQKISQITEDDTFIFTDYDLEVMEVLKDNVSAPLAAGRNIVVTRPGGKIVVDGIIMNVTDDEFLPLPIDNKDVILFLNYVPETGAYQTRSTGSFQVDDEILRPLTELRFPPGVLQDSSSFLKTVRDSQKR